MSRPLLTALFAFLALVGLADSIYLTWDHGAHLIDPASFSGGLCGADGGCAISRESSWSELPVGGDLGLPISLLGAGFYVAFLLLTWRDHATRPKLNQATPISRLQFLLALLAVVYSAVLLGYSISQASICKFCVILYVVNAGLLFLTWRHLGEKPSETFKQLKDTLFSGAAIMSAVVVIIVVAVGFSSYASTVGEAQNKLRAVRQAALADSVSFDLSTQPTKGPKDAPLKLVEYFDFECGHCLNAFNFLNAFQSQRPDLSVTYVNYPLDAACNDAIKGTAPRRSCQLAVLSECAQQQDRFFEVAPVLFQAKSFSASELWTRLSRIQGLDLTKLQQCAKSDEAMALVRADAKQGNILNIKGTPTFFLNGEIFGARLDHNEFNTALDAAKAKLNTTTPGN